MKPLTAKQTELLKLLLCGLPDKQIADKAGVSYGAVRKRFEGLFRKLNTHSRIGLAVAYASEVATNRNTTMRRKGKRA
jgi:DNA-binding NarL/FixJ family response regulator